MEIHKGPFKGKGANRRAINSLEEERDEIVCQMERVVAQFNRKFARPRRINLVVLRRKNPLLYWREAKNSGSYVRLFDTGQGRRILRRIHKDAVPHLVTFEKKRLWFNARMSIVGNALGAFERYKESIDQLNTRR